MLPALIVALIAFGNSLTSYHLSEVSHKKISYYLSYILLFIALILIWQEYAKESNRPILNVFSVKISRDAQPNQYLLWFDIENNKSSELEDMRASVFDMVTAFDNIPKSPMTEFETTTAANKSMAPIKTSLGTIPGNNKAEVYRTIIAGEKLKQYGIFQIELNWNNNEILYSFEIREKKGQLELVNPQVRTKQSTLDPQKFYRYFSGETRDDVNTIKPQRIKFD